MRIIKQIAIGLFVVFFVLQSMGCSSKKAFDTTNICDLQKLNQKNTSPEFPVASQIREDALKDTALSIGAQGALAKRGREIDAMLDANSAHLDQIYNFNGLMLDQNILPPVLVEADRSLTLTNPELLHIADKTYKIIKQAHFVTTPPTWRDYLWFDYKKPDIPDSTLLPRNAAERDLWMQTVVIGWKNGLKQANNIYQTNLATLQRDYKGMMLYRDLLSKDMVTRPQAVGANMGVTSNGDQTEMSINERVLQITATPKFNTNSSEWNPVLIHGN